MRAASPLFLAQPTIATGMSALPVPTSSSENSSMPSLAIVAARNLKMPRFAPSARLSSRRLPRSLSSTPAGTPGSSINSLCSLCLMSAAATDHQSGILRAEGDAVAKRDLGVGGDAAVRNIVEIAFRVGFLVVDGRRQEVVV